MLFDGHPLNAHTINGVRCSLQASPLSCGVGEKRKERPPLRGIARRVHPLKRDSTVHDKLLFIKLFIQIRVEVIYLLNLTIGMVKTVLRLVVTRGMLLPCLQVNSDRISP